MTILGILILLGLVFLFPSMWKLVAGAIVWTVVLAMGLAVLSLLLGAVGIVSAI